MNLHILSSGPVEPIGSDTRGPVIIAFLVFIGISLLWVLMLATQEDNPERLYTADRSLSPVFNGIAMAGEQITVINLLAVPGGIALFGYDAFTVAIDYVVALGVLLLLAQKIRNSGLYTLGDLFSVRVSGPGPRIAGAVVTLGIAIPLLMVQLRAAGIVTALLIGISSDEAQVLCTVVMGCLVAAFAAVADLRGTSFMQVVKVPLTLVTLAVVTLLAVNKFGWDPGRLLDAAVANSREPDAYLSPGLWTQPGSLGPLSTISDHIVMILGTAVVPHLILRISTSLTGRSARRSMSIAAGLNGAFFLLLATTGFAAAAVVGSEDIGAVDANGQSSPILLAEGLLPNGSAARATLITVMACVAFLAALTTVTSATFAAAVSIAHDVFARGKRRHTDIGEVRMLRLAVVLLCAGGLSLAAATHRYAIEFLVVFSLGVAASCIFPALIYSFFWSGFRRRGLLWSVYGGLLLCAVLTFFSPVVSGTEYALWPGVDFHWFPLNNPGVISVPVSFLLGWYGSVTSPENADRKFGRFEYRILTGRNPD
ncbi:cation acetate symporter [Streptomyces sp. NPDC008122]|uniref:sodium/solute symporter n=1 Tax=Streptomyces sp. NPDC008122 TaxID=3364810 RepID=UPI0036EF1782